jgi:hypothetical protein
MQRNLAILRIHTMGTSYERFFQVLTRDSQPAYLCERICEAISRERERVSLQRERTRLIVSSLTSISSLTGLMFALPALMHAAAVSGFSTFASLFITDNDLLVSHFGTFGMSLIEALPGFEVTITLFLLSVFLVSLQNFVTSLAGSHITFKHAAA